MRPHLSLPALSALPLLLCSTAALAEVPAVVADTAPVHALVSLVMGDLGQPAMLLPPGSSPHDAALRPSDAAALAAANVVIWSGEALVPFLTEPVATLAPDAVTVALLETEGWAALPLREDANFAHEHSHGDAHGDEHADEDGHADHDHAEESHDDHDHADHDHDHGHDHGGIDPHAWLDPAVASVWVTVIADTLGSVDPDNAATYAANAQASVAEFDALRAGLVTRLAPLSGRAYLVPHDAYQYFETAFGLPASGAIALSDATGAGPAHVAELQARIADQGISCVLTDPQTSPDLVALVIEGSDVRTAAADPDGQQIAPGAGLYVALIEGVAAALEDCLG